MPLVQLLGLSPKANSADIREFFHGFAIPTGGVCIIGGEMGEAYITFETEKDAYYARKRSGCTLKQSQVFLKRSDRIEKEEACKKRLKSVKKACIDLPQLITDNGVDSNGTQVLKQNTERKETSYSDKSKNVYLYFQGMPTNVTKEKVKDFFIGLHVVDTVLFKTLNGFNNGHGIVKFADETDADAGLERNKKLIDSQPVVIMRTSEEEWLKSGGIVEARVRESSFVKASNGTKASKQNTDSVYLYVHGMPPNVNTVKIKYFFSGLYVEDIVFLKYRNGMRNGNCIVKFVNYKDANEGLKYNHKCVDSRCILLKKADEEEWIKAGGFVDKPRKRLCLPRAYPLRNRSTSSDRKQKSRSRSSHKQDYYVHLKNLPPNLEKKELRKCLNISGMEDSQITFLLDEYGQKISECLVMLKTPNEQFNIHNLNSKMVCGHRVYIKAIAEWTARELAKKGKKYPPKTKESSSQKESTSSKLNCIYLRNFAFDVSKVDIQSFFSEFTLKEEDIFLLNDDEGVGLGEALVKFPSEKDATNAEKLNRKIFLGTEILLRCISEEQMKVFGIDPCLNAPVAKTNSSAVSQEGCQRESPLSLVTIETCSPESTNPKSAGCTSTPQDNDNSTNVNNVYSTYKNIVTVIFVRNLPFNVTVEEILYFFHGHKVISVNVNSSQKGTATVRMESYREALAAINKLHNTEFGTHKVSVSLI
ncbi:RNA-binding protein 12B-like isoform 1-T2 [Discoglossus pictus]